ncbi:MAG: periplasmic serine protease, Do/DeqQ family [Pedosphaera sp.]|nr:periplasmic serine protease, Do/DeqQ family [Pedosphaera sp.]
MNIIKSCPMLFCAATLALAPLPSMAADGTATAKPSANLELARQLNQAFVEVAEEVSPAVVVITVTQRAASSPQLGSADGSDDQSDPLDQFRKYFKQHPPQQQPPEKTHGQGSGIIIRQDGYILTNRHVVEDADKIEVRLRDGRTFKASIRGVDAPSDVAVIKIDATNLTVAKLADSSKTRVGEFAIAIGAPFALDYSVTFGHVSAKDRSNIVDPDSQEPMMDQSFIQTDANINPGNSGGPLVNIDGEVIGINTLIRGLRTGIGFAIPSNMAKEVADKLMTEGKFTRSWLGVNIISYRDFTEFRDLVPGIKDGVVVKEIVAEGPAVKSGLRPSDVITEVDGKPVMTSQQLKDEIRTKKLGQAVTLSVYRWGEQIKIQVKPREYTDKTGDTAVVDGKAVDSSSDKKLGLTVDVLNRSRADKSAIEGVVVTTIDPGGLAARSSATDTGIQEGDIITAINQHAIKDPKQYYDMVKNVDTKKGVIVDFISKGGKGAATFQIVRDGNDD